MDVKALDVDLRSHRAPPRWAWAGLGVLAIAAVGAVAAAIVAQRDVDALRAKRDQLVQQAAQPPALITQAAATVQPYDASARVALTQAEAGWGPLLTSLESVELAGVTPVGIDISTTERQVRLDVEFSDFAALLQYIDAINAGEPAPRWQLVQAAGAGQSKGGSAVQAALATAQIQGKW